MNVSSDTKTILILDDEEEIVDLLVSILESARYNAIGCSRWTEAVEAINRDAPDLVLLDLKMPTIDGPAMLEFLRKEGLDLPVIVVSGFITDEVFRDLSRLGVSAFVRKPFRAREILDEVEKVFADKGGPASSVDALYEAEDEPGARPSHTGSAADDSSETEILAALQKLDGNTGNRSTSPPENDRPESSETSSRDDLLAALRDSAGSGSRTEADAGPSAARSREDPPAASRMVSDPPDAVVGRPAPAQSSSAGDGSGRNVSVTGRRRHGWGSRRKKRFTKRNFFLFGSMFLVCVAVAAFMAVMNWYASQIDVRELQEKTEKAISKQATEEILKQMRDQQ